MNDAMITQPLNTKTIDEKAGVIEIKTEMLQWY